VKGYERKQLLERLDREGSTIGVDIPERITVQGEPVDLREFVFEIKRMETVPPGDRERVRGVKSNLRRERLQRRQRVENDDLSYAEGERIVESILGIDRALNGLESLGPTDLKAEVRHREIADRKRWMSFLKQVLGRDDGADRRAGP